MTAYVIVDIEVTDPQMYETYRTLVSPTIAAHGGRYLVRGGRSEQLEGEWTPHRVVVLEFPSYEAARGWWSSPDYEPVKKIREQSARANMIVVEGL